jgi:hypothetical protein
MTPGTGKNGANAGVEGSENQVALDVGALAVSLEVVDGDAVVAAMRSAWPVPPEASPSAVQHSTNSEGLSSVGPSTWKTFRVWSAWTKRESPAKAG